MHTLAVSGRKKEKCGTQFNAKLSLKKMKKRKSTHKHTNYYQSQTDTYDKKWEKLKNDLAVNGDLILVPPPPVFCEKIKKTTIFPTIVPSNGNKSSNKTKKNTQNTVYL